MGVWLVGLRWCSQRASLPCANLVYPSGDGCTRQAITLSVAESLVEGHTCHEVSTHQIRQGRMITRWSTSQGIAELLRSRITGANREASEGNASLVLPLMFNLNGKRAKVPGALSKEVPNFRRVDVGWCGSFTAEGPHQHETQCSIFPFFPSLRHLLETRAMLIKTIGA